MSERRDKIKKINMFYGNAEKRLANIKRIKSKCKHNFKNRIEESKNAVDGQGTVINNFNELNTKIQSHEAEK
jgi:hypothetical protein